MSRGARSARRLAVSNIAWRAEADDAVAEALRTAGATGIEIAPTMVWRDPVAVSEAEAVAYREAWRARGFPIVAMQSLLFGRDDLRVFGDDATRRATLAHLAAMIRLASWLGARSLVFGSPRNRAVGQLDRRAAAEMGATFFRAVGDSAAAHGVHFCLEPNPPQYGCDYLTTSSECIALLAEVGSPGLGLHLDTAAMTLSGEDPETALRAARPWMRHFHISEPYLAPIGTGGVDHAAFAGALRREGYDGWVSIEMKSDPAEPAAEFVERAVARAVEAYGT